MQQEQGLVTRLVCPSDSLPAASLPPSAACQEPALLRLAVNWVRHQCERGRQLSDAQAAALVNAAGSAFLGGF